jgi:hypothetical protein
MREAIIERFSIISSRVLVFTYRGEGDLVTGTKDKCGSVLEQLIANAAL